MNIIAVGTKIVLRVLNLRSLLSSIGKPVKLPVGGNIEIRECNRSRNVWIVAHTGNLG